ncbi:uncharacterized protein LOC135145174 [Zophobas morio]|uniref:uncharacterized protein LOC135145174 n=1 Tax=Zophobas morio TaxID=2755281 RepID=UPI003082D3B3
MEAKSFKLGQLKDLKSQEKFVNKLLSLLAIANTEENCGKYIQAIKHLKEALVLTQKYLSPKEPLRILTLLLIAKLHARIGYFKEAMTYFELLLADDSFLVKIFYHISLRRHTRY